jgi:hypothetical protein
MADLDDTLLKVSGLNKEQLEEQRAQKEALEAQTQELGDIKSALEKAGIVAEKNKNFLAKSAELEKASLDFNKKTAAEQERLKLLAQGAPLDDMAKQMGSQTFDGIKKFLGMTTLFLVGVLGILKLLQNEKFRDGVMSFLNGIKTVYENLTSFGDAVKDDIKGLPAAGVAITLAFKKLTSAEGPLAVFAKKVGTYADDGVKAITRMFGAGGPPGTKGGIGIRSLLTKLRNIFRPITAFGATLAKMPVVASITKFFAKAGGFFKMLGKLFLPLTIIIGIWDTIKGAMEGYSEESEGTWVDKIVGAIGGGIKGLINSLVGIPLDFLKAALGWLLGKIGFTGAEEKLKDFSFAEEFGKIIDKLFGWIKAGINWMVELFTDPVATLTTLWTGLVGEGGLLDILWAPIKGAIDWIKGLFPSLETISEKFNAFASLGVGGAASWLWNLVKAPIQGAVDWIKSIFPSWETVKASILTVLTYGTAPGWLYLLITGPLKGAIDWIKGLFPSWEDLKAGFTEALGFAKEGANWLLEIITKPFKGIFDFIGKIFDFDFLGMVKKLMPQKLYNWMFGKGEMSKEDIQQEIRDEQERIARSQAGENEYYGREFKGIEGSQERIAELTEQLNEMNGNKAKGGETVVVNDMSNKQITSTNKANTVSIQKETTKQDFVNYDNVAYDY